MKFTFALIASAAALSPLTHPETELAITTIGEHWYGQEPLALVQTQEEGPIQHPQTDLAVTTIGEHWYGQEPLALIQTNAEEPLIHPQTGLAITTTGQHWYGQEPLALNKKASGVRFVNDPIF